MSTEIRPELSRKNKDWIPKERFYELKHFCRQYDYWKKMLFELNGLQKNPIGFVANHSKGEHADPTACCVIRRNEYREHVLMLENIAKGVAGDLVEYLLDGVTHGHKYDFLKARLEIPCSADMYYKMYRRFFKILDEKRG